jgi:uncharacterized membrane protein YdjX (TVP38/TMEM64 family)
MIAIVLFVPVIPFVLLGWYLEPNVEALVRSEWLIGRPALAASILIGLLVADVLLPIPSSLICTISGSLLGPWIGTMTNWIGLSLAAVVGYELGSCFGRPLAIRLQSKQSLERAGHLNEKYGLWTLVLFRGIPILAEASVIAAGLCRQSRLRFLPPVLAANLGISAAYGLLGSWSLAGNWLAIALAISLGIPAAIAAWYLGRKQLSKEL